jgi:hypothetical protein
MFLTKNRAASMKNDARWEVCFFGAQGYSARLLTAGIKPTASPAMKPRMTNTVKSMKVTFAENFLNSVLMMEYAQKMDMMAKMIKAEAVIA